MADRSNITLYSGGHKGAEAEFGSMAERWGIQEVNFSFEGHTIERTRGVRVLGPEELDRGDVSMEIVSARMGRNYSKADKIRKVIQSIFHMVNNGIPRVRRGVDPAGRHRQGREPAGGSSWPGCSTARSASTTRSARGGSPGTTTPGPPRHRSSPHETFVGTGTRNLTEDGRKAVEALFARSFGSPS